MKLVRAHAHLDALDEAAERWLSSDAYTIGREVDPQTGYTVRRARITAPPPAELSLVLGDAVHNLRSALDHAVYALAEGHLGTLSPAVERVLMFPIHGGAPAKGSALFEKVRARQLQGVPPEAQDFIEQEQPYHWDEHGYRFHWLWIIHDLDRVDKHRRLAVTTAFVWHQYVGVPDNVDPDITFTRGEGPVNDGDVLVTYSGADEGVDAHFTRALAVEELPGDSGEALSLLRTCEGRVHWVVQMLATFL